jgi:hypothetical protein
MKLQVHCQNCGAIIFPGGTCRYCKAPVGYEIQGTEKRSARPTVRVPFKGENRWYLIENSLRLLAEAEVLLDPINQDGNRQNQIVRGLVDKYFPAGMYFNIPQEFSDLPNMVSMNCWWTYTLGWERADNNSPWKPRIILWPVGQERAVGQ